MPFGLVCQNVFGTDCVIKNMIYLETFLGAWGS